MTKTYIISDLHVGYDNVNYPKLKSLFNLISNDADKLIICGDYLDLWRCPIGIIQNVNPYKNIYDKLLEIAKTTQTIIIPGNHDYNIGSLNLPNIEIRKPFFEDGIFFTHGWEFDIQQRFGSFFYGYILKHFPYLYQKLFKKPSKIIEEEYDERSFGDPIHAEGLKFAIKNNCKIIMGHTHEPMITNKVIDCGDWLDSLSYIVINDNDRITLNYLEH